MAVLLSLGLISHSPRSQQERTRQEDRYFKFYELRDNLSNREIEVFTPRKGLVGSSPPLRPADRLYSASKAYASRHPPG
jgi:hypothetical protein